jgi:hypothetical protein
MRQCTKQQQRQRQQQQQLLCRVRGLQWMVTRPCTELLKPVLAAAAAAVRS